MLLETDYSSEAFKENTNILLLLTGSFPPKPLKTTAHGLPKISRNLSSNGPTFGKKYKKGYFDFDSGTFAYGNPVAFHGQMLSSAPIDFKEVVDDTECFQACVEDSRCRSTNLKLVEEQSGKFLCQLLDTDKFTSPEAFNGSSDFHHYSFTVSLTGSIDAEFF